MKFKILIFFFIAINFYSNAQFSEPYRYSIVVLKTGDTLVGYGKTKNKGFKYRAHSNVKPYFIDFSEIDYLQQLYSDKNLKTFKFFQINHSIQYFKLEELLKGKYAELYGIIYNVNSSGAGGISISQTVVKYYIKKVSESKITYFGPKLSVGFKEKIINYFADCPELIKKIENKDFRMRDGLEQVVEFYNKNCNPE